MNELEKRIQNLESELATLRHQRAHQIANCRHDWGPVVADFIREESYIIRGDPPGYGGVDRRSDFYVPAKTTPRWKRVCKRCEHVEYTSKTTTTTTEVPKF